MEDLLLPALLAFFVCGFCAGLFFGCAVTLLGFSKAFFKGFTDNVIPLTKLLIKLKSFKEGSDKVKN